MKKFLALLVVLVMMMASMQMVAFAADESTSETASETASEQETSSAPVDTDEEIEPINEVEPENPETGSSAAPIAIASLAVLSLAGAALTMRKK